MKKRFCGYPLDRGQNKLVVSLVEMTCGKLGIHKHFFKTEETFWKAVTFVSGLAPLEGEHFYQAVRRIRGTVGQYAAEKRAKMVSTVDVAAFYDAIGVKAPEGADVKIKHSEVVGRKPRLPRQPKVQKLATGRKPSVALKDQFYKSWEWRTVRMEVLTQHGRACQCCGAEPGMKTSAGDPVRICVDHIKPLSKFWHLRLDRTNLQVLCDECNQGKGAWDQTDFRKPEAPDEWVIEDDEISHAILHQLTDPTTGRLQ